jgi:hypothetical protein
MAVMDKAKQTERVTKKLSGIKAKFATQQKRRARLERVRKAISDFGAGRISKTELRDRVPRSYLT